MRCRRSGIRRSQLAPSLNRSCTSHAVKSSPFTGDQVDFGSPVALFPASRPVSHRSAHAATKASSKAADVRLQLAPAAIAWGAEEPSALRCLPYVAARQSRHRARVGTVHVPENGQLNLPRIKAPAATSTPAYRVTGSSNSSSADAVK